MEEFQNKNIYYILGGHTIYSRNNMHQKCGGNCGLWILHEIIQNEYSDDFEFAQECYYVKNKVGVVDFTKARGGGVVKFQSLQGLGL